MDIITIGLEKIEKKLHNFKQKILIQLQMKQMNVK